MSEDLEKKLDEALGVRVSEVLVELGIPLETYYRILKMSLVSTPESLEGIRTAFSRGDLGGVQRAAHELKGVYANLRVSALSDWAARMDKAAREGAGDEARQCFDSLEESFNRFKGLLGA